MCVCSSARAARRAANEASAVHSEPAAGVCIAVSRPSTPSGPLDVDSDGGQPVARACLARHLAPNVLQGGDKSSWFSSGTRSSVERWARAARLVTASPCLYWRPLGSEHQQCHSRSEVTMAGSCCLLSSPAFGSRNAAGRTNPLLALLHSAPCVLLVRTRQRVRSARWPSLQLPLLQVLLSSLLLHPNAMTSMGLVPLIRRKASHQQAYRDSRASLSTVCAAPFHAHHRFQAKLWTSDRSDTRLACCSP